MTASNSSCAGQGPPSLTTFRVLWLLASRFTEGSPALFPHAASGCPALCKINHGPFRKVPLLCLSLPLLSGVLSLSGLPFLFCFTGFSCRRLGMFALGSEPTVIKSKEACLFIRILQLG